MSAVNIYGRFERRYLPGDSSIDKVPVRLPEVLSEDELPPFTLPPIDASTQIRLISLLPPQQRPGPDSADPLRCIISTHTLADAPPFEAISYTWGGIHRHLPIAAVDADSDEEESLFTTPQLQMALRRLRGSQPRLLWADQLCIDQENPEEKGPQIQLMADVYRRADRVIIWLGEDDLELFPGVMWDADHIADLVDLLGGGSDDDQPASSAARAGEIVDFRLSYHYESLQLKRMRAVRRMLNRPWFRRAWVFQEASLAKELVVQFGQRQLEFEKLKRTVDAINAAAHRTGAHMDTDSLEGGTGGYEIIGIIQKERERALSSEEARRATGGGSGFLSILLQVLRRVECWDPKDLIFAFLAFQTDEGITATDSATEKATEEIWQLAAERIISTSGSLDIFAAAHGGTSKRSLPSWVPDWSNPFPFSRPIALPGSGFQASRGLMHEWRPSADGAKLRVRGKIIDGVPRSTDGACIGELSEHFPFWKQTIWLATLFDLIKQSANRYLTSNAVGPRLGAYVEIKRSNLERDLVRTLVADGALAAQQRLRNLHRYVRCFGKSDGDRARELRQSLIRRNGPPGAQELDEEAAELVADYEFIEQLVLVAENKSIFYTEHLQLAMAARGIQPGDAIAILHGSKTPCILRKAEGESENEYRLISQCYLNGWMYGQSPREFYGKDPDKNPHPHGRWWEEDPDEFVLV